MKKILLDYYWRSGGSFSYTEIPNSPFSSGYNRAQTGLAVAGQLRPADLGSPAGALDVVFTSNFTDGLSFNNLGTSKIRITVSDLWTIGSGSTKGIATISTNDDIELHGKDSNTPFYIEALLAGQSGINWITSATSPDLVLSNVLISCYFAGILASTSSNAYGNFDFQFYRNIGTNTEGEGIYIGNTSTTFAVTDSVNIENAYVTDKGRDGLQLGHITDLYVNKYTCYDVGKTNTSAQDHLVQIVDTNGVIENCIFDYAPRLCNLSCHGVTFRNCYFRFYDASEIGFIGRTDNLSYYPTARHNGEPILFDSCYFDDDSGSSSGSLIQVQERIADVEFLNCVFDTTKSSLYQDTRVVGYTNSLIGTLTTNGNSVASLTAPTYTNHTKTSYSTHGLVTSAFHYNLGMGYRTPD